MGESFMRHAVWGWPNGAIQKVAFVFNANAKSVNSALLDRVLEHIASHDIFYCESLSQAKQACECIVQRRYRVVFSGGGDGTFTQLLRLLTQAGRAQSIGSLPALGVLKLGTGNALARVLDAEDPRQDALYIAGGGTLWPRQLDFVACDDGFLAPFAGVGCDSEVLCDYVRLKREQGGGLAEPFVQSVLGYFLAGMTRTLPRKLLEQKRPRVRVITRGPAYRVVAGKNGDEKVFVAPGSVLYEGPCAIAAAGSIPCLGYSLCLFPFAQHKAGFVHLRVGDIPLLSIMMNLPSVWKGTYRHPQLHDFLVQDVSLQLDRPLPYQVAGDSRGHRQRLTFRAKPSPVRLVGLAPDRAPVPPRLPVASTHSERASA